MEDRIIGIINTKLSEITPGLLDEIYDILKIEQDSFVSKYKDEILKDKSKSSFDIINEKEILKEAFNEYEINHSASREEYIDVENKYNQEIENGNLIEYRVNEIKKELFHSTQNDVAEMYKKSNQKQIEYINKIIEQKKNECKETGIIKPDEQIYKLSIREYKKQNEYKIFRAEFNEIKKVHDVNEKRRKEIELIKDIGYMRDDEIKKIQYEKISEINSIVEGYKKEIILENNENGKTITGEKEVAEAFWKFLDDTQNNQIIKEYTAIKNRMKELGFTKAKTEEKTETLQNEHKKTKTVTADRER